MGRRKCEVNKLIKTISYGMCRINKQRPVKTFDGSLQDPICKSEVPKKLDFFYRAKGEFELMKLAECPGGKSILWLSKGSVLCMVNRNKLTIVLRVLRELFVMTTMACVGKKSPSRVPGLRSDSINESTHLKAGEPI